MSFLPFFSFFFHHSNCLRIILLPLNKCSFFFKSIFCIQMRRFSYAHRCLVYSPSNAVLSIKNDSETQMERGRWFAITSPYLLPKRYNEKCPNKSNINAYYKPKSFYQLSNLSSTIDIEVL